MTEHILRAFWDTIQNPKATRADVAVHYGTLLAWYRAGHEVDIRPINEAIISRWSVHALGWIKTKAWKDWQKLKPAVERWHLAARGE